MKLFSKKTVIKPVLTREQQLEQEVAKTKLALATMNRRRREQQFNEMADVIRQNDELWAGRR